MIGRWSASTIGSALLTRGSNGGSIRNKSEDGRRLFVVDEAAINDNGKPCGALVFWVGLSLLTGRARLCRALILFREVCLISTGSRPTTGLIPWQCRPSEGERAEVHFH